MVDPDVNINWHFFVIVHVKGAIDGACCHQVAHMARHQRGNVRIIRNRFYVTDYKNLFDQVDCARASTEKIHVKIFYVPVLFWVTKVSQWRNG